MNKSRIEQLARDHKDLAEGRRLREQPDTDAARQAEIQALARLWDELERECAAYCDCYNQAFGAARLREERHPDTIVVRSQLQQEDTLVFRRALPSESHRANLEGHRYHYGAHPVDLPIAITHGDSGSLMLTYDGQDISAEELVLQVLGAFSEQLARAERRSAGAAGRDRAGALQG
jgi:hypothetical protein